MGNTACGEQVPCFTCCDDGKNEYQRRRTPRATRTLSAPGYEVELAVSPLAGLKGVAGYHSSVLIQGEEYFFSPMGIIHSPNVSSHKKNPHMQRLFIGLSRYSGSDLIEFFDSHFPPGHYDLLRKNCNSFSDCALYFLCEQRLDLKFRTVERFGKFADDNAGLIQSISGGEYLPNPQAVGFDLEAVIREIDNERPEIDENLDKAQQALENDNDVFRSSASKAADDEVHPGDLKAGTMGGFKTPPDLLDFKMISSPSGSPGSDFDKFIKSPTNGTGTTISKSLGYEDGSTGSGPTDPLGITLTAPSSAAELKSPPKSPVKKSMAIREHVKRKEPKTWNELRQVPSPVAKQPLPGSRQPGARVYSEPDLLK